MDDIEEEKEKMGGFFTANSANAAQNAAKADDEAQEIIE